MPNIGKPLVAWHVRYVPTVVQIGEGQASIVCAEVGVGVTKSNARAAMTTTIVKCLPNMPSPLQFLVNCGASTRVSLVVSTHLTPQKI